jgi:hypothetical protein
MRTDVYTKVVLTIIAMMLTVIACRPLASPESTARAEGPLAGVQFLSVGGTRLLGYRHPHRERLELGI